MFALSLDAFAGPRPLEFADIIEQREPFSPRLSPDGSRVAFLVRQASLRENASKVSLWLVAPGSPARRLLEAASIGSLEWVPDGSALAASLPRPGRAALWLIPLNGDGPRPLFEHPARPVSYSWSPDGSKLLFVAAEEPPAGQRDRIDHEGVVYDETVHGIRSFTQRNWTPPGAQRLWLWRREGKQAERIDADLSPVKTFGKYSWAPNGRLVAIEYVPSGGPDLNMVNHIGVLDLDAAAGKAQAFTPRVTTAVANRGPEWHPNSGAIVFASTGDPERFYAVQSAVRILRLNEPQPAVAPLDGEWSFLDRVTYDAAGGHLLMEYENRSRSTLYRVPVSGGRAQPAPGGTAHFSAFHFSRDKKRAACIPNRSTGITIIL